MKSVRALFFLTALLAAAPAVQADRLEAMISPVTNPVNFEDPRINSELRPIYMYHEIDEDFVTTGGDVRLYALQARFALSDRLAIIATKDGYVNFNPDAGLADDDGFANVTAGLKYALISDPEAGKILTAGLRYEIPMGNRDVFFGEGDGFINPFVSGALALGNVNVMAGSGFRLPIAEEDSSFYEASLHIDTDIGGIYPLVEFHMQHVLEAGERLPIADEGQDLFSFGSTESDGKTIVTGAIGARYRVSECLDVGAAYEIPLTSGRGSNITDWRVTADAIFSFDLGL